jgi:two-component sensor histidine kinase
MNNLNFKIILVFLLFSFSLSAQKKNNEKIDSIAKSISDKAWSFINKESDSALYYANKGIQYSKENNSKQGEVVNLEVKGLYYEQVKNDYKKAVNAYLEGISLAEKHYPVFLPMLYSGLSNLYNRTKDLKRALFYAEKAVTHSEENTRMKSGTMLNLAIMQSDLNNFEEANKTFSAILKKNKLNPWGLIIAKAGIASNFSKQKKYKEAIVLYKETILTDSLNGNNRYRRYYEGIIDNSIELGNKNTVEKYLPIFKKSFRERKSLEEKMNYFTTISNSYHLLEDYKNASIYKDSLISVNLELHEKQYDKGIVDADIKYQTEKKEAQIISETGKRKFWLISAFLSFTILTITIISLYKNIQKRKQLSESKKLLETSLNQRNMLLRETHHRVKNSFQMVSSLLKLQAKGSKAEGAVLALDNAVQRVNSMIILHQQLYAKDNILDINLNKYIKDLITEIIRSYETENIIINQQISSINVNIDTATSIGLLINELATNSIKHAWDKDFMDKKITIQIDTKDEILNFIMFDNGTNTNEKLTNPGYGSELITILIKRLKAVKLESDKNKFSIRLEIPIKKNDV